ncbi:tubulin binding cofactor A [Fusarium austroafricanum]|uniref:Tubulin-specific chaperone A n=1 Tax=Fusarium austroafricanum TaxID=2364996 RepID=A0A8H4PC96_9HYPO|nr:tubulin binding cofactor A [Fusarium austroafricanum]
MPPPSQLAIATGSVNRLLKEEASYHKEVEQEEAKVKALKEKIDSGANDDENASFMLKQQQTALEQTKAVFEPLRQKIAVAVEKLEEQLALSEQLNTLEEQVQQAKEALAKAKATENGA